MRNAKAAFRRMKVLSIPRHSELDRAFRAGGATTGNTLSSCLDSAWEVLVQSRLPGKSPTTKNKFRLYHYPWFTFLLPNRPIPLEWTVFTGMW